MKNRKFGIFPIKNALIRFSLGISLAHYCFSNLLVVEDHLFKE